MDHLTIDDIIDFVSLSEMNKEAVELSATVNGHIRKCEKCLRLVRAFQMIYDEFTRLSSDEDFKGYVFEKLLKDADKNEKVIEVKSVVEDFDDYK